MNKRDHDNEEAIREKAIALLTRRDAGWSPEEAAEFALWRAADPRHEAAVRRIESTQRLLERLP
jgi:transmembrane sensor